MIPMPSKKIILIVISALVVLAIVGGYSLWLTTPRRTLNKFLEAIEQGKQATAMSFVSDSIQKKRIDNVEWFIEDWTAAEKLTTSVGKEESWRSRVTTPDDPNTKKNELTNEQKPTPKYWAHYYHADVTVTFDDYEDPVIITLSRNTVNTWSSLAQIFKGWKVSRIRYQPIDEGAQLDLDEIELDDLGLDENGEAEVEVDAEGDVIDNENADSENSDEAEEQTSDNDETEE